jgi:hypothetical protein
MATAYSADMRLRVIGRVQSGASRREAAIEPHRCLFAELWRDIRCCSYPGLMRQASQSCSPPLVRSATHAAFCSVHRSAVFVAGGPTGGSVARVGMQGGM